MSESGVASRFRAQRGAALVEFAVVAPLLFLLLFGVIEFGRLVATYTSVSTAAREGARYATATGEGDSGTPRYVDCPGILAAVAAKSPLLDPSQLDVTVSWPGSGHNCDDNLPGPEQVASGDRVEVIVKTDFSSPIPLISVFLDDIEVQSTQRRTVFRGVING